jgi:hypothetical protein
MTHSGHQAILAVRSQTKPCFCSQYRMHDFAGCSWGRKLGKKKGAAARKPLTVLQLKAKARQSSKLAEIRDTLIKLGFDTAAKQAAALGVGRSTAWVVLNRDKRAGPSAVVIKRIISSLRLPPAVRRKFIEYVEEKIAGLYGHEKDRRRWFRSQFRAPVSNDNEVRAGVPPSV